MGFECPQLAADAIQGLEDQGLHPSLDDISELIELAKRVEKPDHQTDYTLSYAGVRVGNSHHFLRPLSIKAGIWFDFIMDRLSSHESVLACAFAMERGHLESEDFSEPFNLDKAREKIASYQMSLSCNMHELEEAIDRCTTDYTEGDAVRADRGGGEGKGVQDIILQLVSVTSQTEDYWLSKTPSYAMQVLEHAYRFSASAFGAASNNDHSYMRASFDFNCTVARIERELIAASGEGVSAGE